MAADVGEDLWSPRRAKKVRSVSEGNGPATFPDKGICRRISIRGMLRSLLGDFAAALVAVSLCDPTLTLAVNSPTRAEETTGLAGGDEGAGIEACFGAFGSSSNGSTSGTTTENDGAIAMAG